MRTLLHNIGQLFVVPPGPVSGERFSAPPIIENAALVIEDGRIAWFGPKGQRPEGPFDETVDAGGGCVTPGLVDCHTHVVFAGSREGEFVQRIQGKTYLEIMEAGGGIRRTMRAVRAASVGELVEESLPRVQRMIAGGVTTLEIKSGYGLTLDDEYKMLEAIREIATQVPIEIVATYLGAHAVPQEFENRSDAFVELMVYEKYLRLLVRGGLAAFADVFCECGAFSVDQSRRFLTACKNAGLTPKIHAEQITHSGGTRMAVELGAASADHLECVDDEDIAALKASKTIPVLLPGCSFFLNTPPAPARKLIDAGLPVALATDCNPGSSMVESLPLVMSIACTMLRMTPVECLVACTANAAAALRRADRIGAIAVGYQADLLVIDVPNIDAWPYRVGVNAVRSVLKRGRPIFPVLHSA